MTTLGLTAAQAQNYNIIAMVTFLTSRFICTFLLGYIRPGQLLLILALGGIALCLGAVFLDGYAGLYSLIGISACMSLMFPTIYGIALKGMGDDASLASAGLVMAIVGGALMPPLQGAMIDAGPIIGDIPSVKTSFLLPLVCVRRGRGLRLSRLPRLRGLGLPQRQAWSAALTGRCPRRACHSAPFGYSKALSDSGRIRTLKPGASGAR